MIPSGQKPAITHALKETFDVDGFDDIRDLTERPGSNRAFRIVVQRTPYLLRINTRPGDMHRHFTCMRAAADAGLAPRVWYANPAERISITDFVEAVPLSAVDALLRIPATLRNLHALPPFPTAPFNTTCTFLLKQGPALDAFLKNFRSSSVLPASETEELLQRCQNVATAYSRLEPDLTPCHNDLFKPDNILFDGNRVWLVDWEASFQNDRYADLAVVANMLANDESDELIYLEKYFGATPDEYQRARFHVMRQLAHLFYAMGFLTLGPPVKPAERTTYADFQRRFWAREAGLSDAHARTTYGQIHWERLSHNNRQPRFEEALKILSHRTSIR